MDLSELRHLGGRPSFVPQRCAVPASHRLDSSMAMWGRGQVWRSAMATNLKQLPRCNYTRYIAAGCPSPLSGRFRVLALV